jgi:disulfide bond formation protein DsbB
MENPVVLFMAVGTLLTEISLLAYLAALSLHRFTYIELEKFGHLQEKIKLRYREIGLFFAFLATSGSLYLSNVLGWTPCHLCWFQRIFMYPMVLLFGTALFFDREDVAEYIVPLSLTGLAISIYHYMIQFLPKLQSATCSITEVTCQSKYTFYFGHITIPVMAGAAFAAILLVCLTEYRK